MYARMFAHTYTHTHTHTHARTHARTHTRIHTRTQIHTRTHARTHARTHTHTHTRTVLQCVNTLSFCPSIISTVLLNRPVDSRVAIQSGSWSPAERCGHGLACDGHPHRSNIIMRKCKCFFREVVWLRPVHACM